MRAASALWTFAVWRFVPTSVAVIRFLFAIPSLNPVSISIRSSLYLIPSLRIEIFAGADECRPSVGFETSKGGEVQG